MRITKFVLAILLILTMSGMTVLLTGCPEGDTILSGSTLRPDNYPGSEVDDWTVEEDGRALEDEPESSSDEPETGNDEPEVKPELTVDPAKVDFGQVCVGETKTVKLKVTNTGNCDLVIKNIPWVYWYKVTPDVEGDTKTLAPGKYYTLTAEFTPDAEGKNVGVFKLEYKYSSDDKELDGSKSVDLSGEGIICKPKPWSVFLSALNLNYVTVPPCTCPTWPACGCGPGIYNFTITLTVMGDDPEPMPGASVTLSVTGPGTEKTLTVTTDSAGGAQTTFDTSTDNSGKFTVTVVDITGEYDDRDMEYTPDMNTVSEANTTAQ